MWRPERPFPIDMAGFGISLGAFLATPEAKFALEVERGYQESELLKYFVPSREDLEVLADGCTKVRVTRFKQFCYQTLYTRSANKSIPKSGHSARRSTSGTRGRKRSKWTRRKSGKKWNSRRRIWILKCDTKKHVVLVSRKFPRG